MQHVSLAHEFEECVKKDSLFEITHPVTLGLICFRLKVQIYIKVIVFVKAPRNGKNIGDLLLLLGVHLITKGFLLGFKWDEWNSPEKDQRGRQDSPGTFPIKRSLLPAPCRVRDEDRILWHQVCLGCHKGDFEHSVRRQVELGKLFCFLYRRLHFRVISCQKAVFSSLNIRYILLDLYYFAAKQNAGTMFIQEQFILAVFHVLFAATGVSEMSFFVALFGEF